MKILFFVTTIEESLGGIARSVPRLAQAVAEAGGSVVLLAPKAPHPTVTEGDLPDVDLRLAKTGGDLQSALEYSIEEVRAAGGVVYHAGVWSPWNHLCASLAYKAEVPYIASPRSMLDPWALNHRKWKKRLAWWLYAKRDMARAAAIHATAEIEAANIRKCGLTERIIVVPHGIDPPPTDLAPVEKGPLKRLLFLSRLTPKKGIQDLIGAFAATAGDDWELVIAGNDEDGYRARMEAYVASLPQQPNLRFVGAVADADKWALYASADLFVLPSYSENFGLVVGEALVSGVPVITTEATPWSELPQRGCGWCIPVGEAALKATFESVLPMPRSELEAMGERGKQWAMQAFPWEARGREILEIAERVFGNYEG